MTFVRPLVVTAVGAALLIGAHPAIAGKAPACRKSCTTTTSDTTAPSVAISSPSSSTTVAGSVTVAGSAADNTALSAVDVSVDGGAWQRASGTGSWSWSWGTTGAANGGHTVTARATDTSGNSRTSSVSVTVSNTTPDTTAPAVAISSPAASATVSGSTAVTGTASDDRALSSVQVSVDGGAWSTASGTSSWSWTWSTSSVSDGSHTVTVRAVDASGNASTASRTVTVSNAAAPAPTSAPNTQGTWVSPEGVHLSVATAGPWTLSSVYSLLKANALDLDRIGPSLTVKVQDSQASYTTTSAGMTSGRYTTYVSTIWLQGTSSSFANTPDNVMAHEYGHAWSQYHYWITHQASWASYLSARWSTADGGTSLATDSRTNSSYTWTVNEIVADDYRLLLGSATAVSQKTTHLNTTIPAPSAVTGLKAYLSGAFRTA